MFNKHKHSAFTIIELVVVVAVVAILATLVIVAYSSVSTNAKDAALKSDITAAAAKLNAYKSNYGSYPTSISNNCPTAPVVDSNYCFTPSSSNSVYYYSGTSSTMTLTMNTSTIIYSVNQNTTTPIKGTIPSQPTITSYSSPGSGQLNINFTAGSDGGSALTNYQYSINGGTTWTNRSPASTASPLLITGLSNGITYNIRLRAVNSIDYSAQSNQIAAIIIADGTNMQVITSANCPTTRTRAVDARDNHTYWVQKLADGKCWMLTNLAYAGGGTNTYGDIVTISNGTSDTTTYIAVAKYYIVPSTTNFTIEPTNPSTSTTGTGQYGYLYNSCGVLASQAGACSSGGTPTPDPSISICPGGWRVPSAGGGGQYQALNTAINGGSTTSDANLRSVWLGQYGGYWGGGGFGAAGIQARYWSSSQGGLGSNPYMYFGPTEVGPTYSFNKDYGFAVRCIAN